MAKLGNTVHSASGSRYGTGLDSPGFPEAADISTTDHQFSSPARMLRVAASGAATLVLRPNGGASDGSDDVTVTLVAGIEYLPFVTSHIIMSGTTNSLKIIGVL